MLKTPGDCLQTTVSVNVHPRLLSLNISIIPISLSEACLKPVWSLSASSKASLEVGLCWQTQPWADLGVDDIQITLLQKCREVCKLWKIQSQAWDKTLRSLGEETNHLRIRDENRHHLQNRDRQLCTHAHILKISCMFDSVITDSHRFNLIILAFGNERVSLLAALLLVRTFFLRTHMPFMALWLDFTDAYFSQYEKGRLWCALDNRHNSLR